MGYCPGASQAVTETPRCHNQLLASLPTDVYEPLAENLKLVKLKRRSTICHEGDDLKTVYFPETSVISECKTLEDGRMLELSILGREGAVGLVELFSDEHDSQRRKQVVYSGIAQAIPRSALEKFMHQDDRLRSELGHYVSKYVGHISQRNLCGSFHSVRQRFCLWLMMIHDRTASLMIKATHEELANALGVYRPTVTILSQELRDDGLVSNSRGTFEIADPAKLRHAACECYALLAS